MKNTTGPIKSSVESFPDIIDHMEERISVYEDKVQELDDSVRGKHEIFKCVNGTCTNFRTL